MDRFQAISTFARVVEAGSFAGAAQRLGVSVSSVSRLVAELETHLGARPAQPHHAPHLADRSGPLVPRALSAAAG